MHQEQIEASLARHRAQPEVSTATYFNTLSSLLGREIAPKTKVYLDTCYWVFLREAAQGKPRRSEHVVMLAQLRELVQAGQVICPVSDAAFVETMQHADPDTRLATAAMLDELSGGVCLRTESERVAIELKRFMEDPGGSGGVGSDEAWVRPGLLLGARVPSLSGGNAAANRALQKAFIDVAWGMSFADMAAQDLDQRFAQAMERSASTLNAKNLEYAPSIRSFKQAFTAELSGSIKFFDEKVAQLILAEHQQETSEDNVAAFKQTMQTALFNVFRHRPKLMARRCPTLYVHAACHAAVRWDKGRQLNGHWLVDFHHACAATGYHDVMFTEGPLRVLMTNGLLKLDRLFNMPLISDAAAAVAYLRGLQTTLGGSHTPGTAVIP